FNAAQLLLVDRKARHVTHSGQHAKDILERAKLAHHFELREEIVEIEFRAAQLSLQPLRFFFVYRFGRFLDQTHDVAHSENATRQPIGDEGFELIELFANAGKFDWALRHFAHGESCTAPRVAVEFGQNNSRDLKSTIAMCRDADRLLVGGSISYEQNF